MREKVHAATRGIDRVNGSCRENMLSMDAVEDGDVTRHTRVNAPKMFPMWDYYMRLMPLSHEARGALSRSAPHAVTYGASLHLNRIRLNW